MRWNILGWLASLLIFLSLSTAGFAQRVQVVDPSEADAEPSAPAPEGMLQDEHDALAGGHDGMGGEHAGHRADFQPPAAVMLAHVHSQGDWIVGYRYSNVYMNGNQTGTKPLTTQQAIDFLGPVPPGIPGVNTFKMAPISMTMEMHMMPIMHAVTDDVTLYLMPTWVDSTMDMVGRNGVVVRASNGGISDLSFGALWRIYQGCSDEVVLNIGLSAPTGDIDNINPVAAGTATPFPYTMRLGRGTWDARPGATYRYFWDRASIGFQGLFDLPMGLNDAHYRVGDEYRVSGWFAYLLDAEKRLAVSYRVEGLWRTDYVGADPRLNPFSMSGANANMRAGQYLNFGYGVTYRLPSRLGLLEAEYVHPIVQDLEGVQGTTVGSLTVRYIKTF